MKKSILFFVGVFFVAHSAGLAAVAIKKAAPVATQQAEKMDSAASLLGTVVSLVSTVQQLNQQQKALTAECVPSSQEINFVNKMVKEWAMTGALSADEAFTVLGGVQMRCSRPDGEYQESLNDAAALDDFSFVCYDYFGTAADEGMIWARYPKAVLASYCKDGSLTCKEKIQVSNVYDVFNLIDFDEVDYYGNEEIKMASVLMDKIEKCSNAKLSARKKALWGDFLVNTMSGVGQKTNTGNIMQAVSGMAASSGNGVGGMLQSLGGVATQMLLPQ